MTFIVISFLIIMLLIYIFVLSVSKISNEKISCNKNLKTTQNTQNKARLTLLKQIMADFHNAGCDIWDESIHKAPGQFERMQRGFEQPITILSFNDETGTAEIEGTSGERYTTSLFGCNCPDFTFRQLPCKHMYHLAMELGFNNSIPNEFKNKHQKEIKKWHKEINSALEYDHQSPYSKAGSFNKALDIYRKFEDWCDSIKGGSSYFLDNEYDKRNEIEERLDNYLDNYYYKEKNEYDKTDKYKQLHDKYKKEIFSFISKNEGTSLAKIESNFPSEDIYIIIDTIVHLLGNNKIKEQRERYKSFYYTY